MTIPNCIHWDSWLEGCCRRHESPSRKEEICNSFPFGVVTSANNLWVSWVFERSFIICATHEPMLIFSFRNDMTSRPGWIPQTFHFWSFEPMLFQDFTENGCIVHLLVVLSSFANKLSTTTICPAGQRFINFLVSPPSSQTENCISKQ